MRTEDEICVHEVLKTQMQSYFNFQWKSRKAITVPVNSMNHQQVSVESNTTNSKHTSLSLYICGEVACVPFYNTSYVFCTEL